jgi:hypothetical protein
MSDIPEELFDGYAVHREVENSTGVNMNPTDVSRVLDAVVKLIKERLKHNYTG